MEKIEKEIKVTRWVAEDGTEFETEHECAMYECSELGELMCKLKPCIVGMFDGGMIPFATYSAYDKVYSLMPKTRNDYYLINRILELGGSVGKISGGNDYKLFFLGLTTSNNIICAADIVDMDEWVRDVTNNKFTVVTLIKNTEERKK